MRFAILSALVLSCVVTPHTAACTSIVFQDKDALLFARNFDWQWGDGMVIVNQRGIAKTAFVRPSEHPARWTSEFGSVTFNQWGREMPYGGINEAGLVIAQMMLMDTEYAEPDDRPVVNMLQWIQYQLDNSDTLEEVIASDEKVALARPHGDERIHYLVCDAEGNAGTIEFLEGKLVCHRGQTLPVTALTNNTYDESTDFAKAHDGLGGQRPVPGGHESLHRFARAAICVREFQSRSPGEDRDYCFAALGKVAQGPATVWSLVYDIPTRRVYFRTFDKADLRWFDLDDFDFSPGAAPMFLDINADQEGQVAESFRELSQDQHTQQLMAFFGKPDVKQRYGDLSAMVNGLNFVLSTYRPVAAQLTNEKELVPSGGGH